ncbi:tRNA adenosine(34) deaminase TadA [Pseudoalteromonas sp. SG45-5]|uniref:tRNA adenosine(34) deaminase TadA n=1 Tax=unclassified Pseudoalteromonas TaxID=194690 RepID=UPI0015FD2309|nr:MULTISPECIES: tRNA adenosine(34) deaminase TadA [unclassified Pseudoalteromonas]MBB1384544.1 tRNA adenosine(34) deaminase TadA [Pseudoalteromonas sp. SG45-5]MBB1393260.1 tRNA adenosine(34) deaminase TadA [Pseudoalteromonas sp. SG44-4]MBB1447135.1 tRNA adenosine(34) deaminase TadA [Pseudoalteromonas sp. SG41-6]
MNEQFDDSYWMEQALLYAKQAEQLNEIPVGAIVVKDNQLVSAGYNRSITDNDPSAHAEMIAIREAGKVLNNYRLIDCTLYVTLEPCSMCAGLLVHSRIKRLVFGAADAKTGSAGSIMNLLQEPRLNHQVDVCGGVLSEQCGNAISDFFKSRRAQIKAAKKAARDAADFS